MNSPFSRLLPLFLRKKKDPRPRRHNIWKKGMHLKDPNTLVFLGINRTGSSSIFAWLNTHNIKYCMSRYQEDTERNYALIKEIESRDLRAFAVVRNPWDRAVSSWKHCMDKKQFPRCTFKEFIHAPLEQMTPQQRYHSSPQWPHIVDCDGKIAHLNHVGRFENLLGTCDWIANALEFEPQEPIPHNNSSDRKQYASYYDEQCIQKVAQVFRQDIEMFDYSFDESGATS
jgi:hypothetical protein